MRPILLMLLSSTVMLAPQTPVPDFNKARDEAIQILQGLINIDTSNPPPETKAKPRHT